MHTKGEWIHSIGNQVRVKIGTALCTLAVPDDDPLIPISEQIANMRLMSASPDLLTALEKLVLWHTDDEQFIEDAAEYGTVNGITSQTFEEQLYEQAKAAITKAKGNQ